MHIFEGKWISNAEMAQIAPRNVFHRQLDRVTLDCSEHRNRHILFRKHFCVKDGFASAKLFITADDYYKLYVNGKFVSQGPAPSYHFNYNYNEIDITPYLVAGENLIAVHTLYQGLINRVWQSGDFRHGLLCDLVIDGATVLSSDESFLVATHTGYREMGVCGYETQFMESYDARAREHGFEGTAYDDSGWENAVPCAFDDHTVTPQRTAMLVFEEIAPVSVAKDGCVSVYDFGSNYVGTLRLTAKGNAGDTVTLRFGQELCEDGRVRHELRANCVYEETFTLASGELFLDPFDYKAFRYAEVIAPDTVTVTGVHLLARHYPFSTATAPKEDYVRDERIRAIFDLCVHTQKYGVQEVIQDCMEREKGFYLGDGCYTALTNLILTHDDSMVRKLIDDAFSTSFITDTLITCMDCSFMQEIAEFPLILVLLVLWHYRFTHDKEYLAKNYPRVTALLDAYRREYEKDGVLRDLDKWCVVEWPMNFRHGYDVDILEGKVCHEAHVSLNAYYLAAVRAANAIAKELSLSAYRDEGVLMDAFYRTFYDKERDLFKDGENTDHASLVGNSFVYAFGLYRDESTKKNFLAMLDAHGVGTLSLFCTFPVLAGLCRDGDDARIKAALLDEGAWLRMLREGATTTFEGWGKDTKWNTSLFHLTMSYAATFIADEDIRAVFA